MATTPPLERVLANVVPGRDQRLRLSERQRRGLGDRDGRIALQELRALVRARKATRNAPVKGSPAEPFPLTETPSKQSPAGSAITSETNGQERSSSAASGSRFSRALAPTVRATRGRPPGRA